jgi:hypothetical protein
MIHLKRLFVGSLVVSGSFGFGILVVAYPLLVAEVCVVGLAYAVGWALLG